MGKIAIYTRVSSVRQAEDDRYSLTVQKERCEALLKSQGYVDEDIMYFCDAGISGTTIEGRDEMKELLKQLDKTECIIEGICCYDLSRLSRSISNTLDIFKLLKENHLKFYTCDGAFLGDIDSQNAKIMVSIYSMLNELFIDQLREKVLDGMNKSVEAGNYLGGTPPFGYRYEYYKINNQDDESNEVFDKKSKKKDIKTRLSVDYDEKSIIEMIFNLFTKEKVSIKGVAQYLNLNGYCSRENRQFSTATIQKILENPIYAGRIFWGKKKLKKKTEQGVRIWDKTKIYDVDFFDLPQGKHEAIITEEFFVETLERLCKRRKIRENTNMADEMSGITKNVYFDANKKMFINILKCPNCGGNMTSSLQPSPILADGTRKPAKTYYKCSTFNAGKNLCDGYYSMQEDRVFSMIKEDFFIRLKEAFVLVKEYQNYLKESNKNDNNEEIIFDVEIKKMEEELKNIGKNEAKLISKLDNLIERQLEEDRDTIKFSRLENMIKETEISIQDVRKFKIEQTERIEQKKKRREVLLQETEQQEQFENMEDYFNSLSLLQRRELLEKVYTKIVVDTISNARFGPKKLEIKEIEYNQYTNIYGLCKILGVSDLKEFSSYMEKKGQKLDMFIQHFGDSEEYIKELDKQYENEKINKYLQELSIYADNTKNVEDEFIQFFVDKIEENSNEIDDEVYEEKFKKAYSYFIELLEKKQNSIL